MALTAVITQPLIGGNPDPYLYVGYSYVRFHGFNSILDGSNHAIVDYEWDWKDGSPNTYGPIASHCYQTSGSKSPTLTVTDTVGAKHTVSITFTFTTWTGTIFYVSDISGNDSNAGTSTSIPVKTLLHALVLCNAATVAGTPAAVSLKLGESYPYPGPGILGDSGRLACPMLGNTWGSGADPIINVATGEWLWRAADVHVPQDDWGYSVQIQHWDVRWSVANTDDGAGDFRFGSTMHGSTFIGCKVTKGTFEATDGNLAPKKITWDGCEATGAGGHPGGGGIGFSNSGAGIISFYGVLNCNIHNNSAGRATNAYFHGDLLEVRGNTFDTENNGVVDALLMSGCQKYVVMSNTFKYGTNSCITIGSNGSVDGSREAQDCWVEFNYCAPLGTGINGQYVNRGVIKNNVINGGTVGIYLGHSYYLYLTERTQNLDVLGNVLYGQSNESIWTNGVRSIRFRNNGIVKSNSVPGGGGDSHFVELGLSSQSTSDDYLYVTCDGNGYYDSLVSTSTDYAFIFNDSHKTFTQWQAGGFDAGSGSTTVFGQDPLLTNPAGGDFSIPTGSPWKNVGVATPEEFRDFTVRVRATLSTQIDVGAYEVSEGKVTTHRCKLNV